uniref:Uncharacterized protein n=1 Tax=Apteryx owenii TaxID=8824 RepID=A0A8B9PUX0_APTOW
MAKWLNKYFSLGNNKTKSPPQPPRPDYRENDLLRAYRAQKDRDFEDPYSGPGSSLRKLRAICRPDYCAPEDAGEAVALSLSGRAGLQVYLSVLWVTAHPQFNNCHQGPWIAVLLLNRA